MPTCPLSGCGDPQQGSTSRVSTLPGTGPQPSSAAGSFGGGHCHALRSQLPEGEGRGTGRHLLGARSGRGGGRGGGRTHAVGGDYRRAAPSPARRAAAPRPVQSVTHLLPGLLPHHCPHPLTSAGPPRPPRASPSPRKDLRAPSPSGRRRFPGQHRGLSNPAGVSVVFHCFVYLFYMLNCGT